MSHPWNGAPHVIGRMSLSECWHRGVANSVGDDEIDFGIGGLLDAACELGHGRIEIWLKSVAAATVEPMAGRAVFLVLRPGCLEIFRRRREGICNSRRV